MSQLPDIEEYGLGIDMKTVPSPVISFEEDEEEKEEVVAEEMVGELKQSPMFGLQDTILTDDLMKQKPMDFSRLASANFSTDSLNGSPDLIPFTPLTPTLNAASLNTPTMNAGPNFQQVPIHNRRFSNSSLSGSPLNPPMTGNSRISRPRPRSAYFVDNQNSISEDGSPVQIPISNTPRSRNSLGYLPKPAYIPNNFGPPLVQTSQNVLVSTSRLSSPTRNRNYAPKSPVHRSTSPSKSNPFNFKPQEVMLHNLGSNPSLNVKPAHRKGHKYKHSSVSMNLFQEPVQIFEKNKQLLEIPDLFPIPNFRESIASINPNQKFKLLWSIFHFSLSIIIFILGFKFNISAFSTLAHLIFYDSLGTILIVIVEIMSNFEVWNNSSIVYPFGLGRLEVLVGFGLSASLIMVGLDLISHSVEEFILVLLATDNNAEHPLPHSLSQHTHGGGLGNINWFFYELTLLLLIIVTLITSNFILVSDKIKEMISEDNTVLPLLKKGSLLDQETSSVVRKNPISKLQKYFYAWTKNPTHLLTLIYCIYLMFYPIISHFTETDDLNDLASLTAAILLCCTGWRLVTTLGGILLCSYPYNDYEYYMLKSSIMDQILALDFFKKSYRIEKFFITKFNYKLFVVGLQIEMKGATSDDDARIRFEIHRIVKREIESISLLTANSDIEITIDVIRI